LKIANRKSGTSGAYFDWHENHLGRTPKGRASQFYHMNEVQTSLLNESRFGIMKTVF